MAVQILFQFIRIEQVNIGKDIVELISTSMPFIIRSFIPSPVGIIGIIFQDYPCLPDFDFSIMEQRWFRNRIFCLSEKEVGCVLTHRSFSWCVTPFDRRVLSNVEWLRANAPPQSIIKISYNACKR
jgi:hypothetical protein